MERPSWIREAKMIEMVVSLYAELAQRGGGGRDAKDFAYALDELGVRRSIAWEHTFCTSMHWAFPKHCCRPSHSVQM